ncbi:30S ribosomal protein S10 [Candidatus Kaiserbacteria bacterium CG_4_9_14_3_um_filter_50_16]|nr:MAG: 30S ribosomal protein S10 [Candidatus Kaiserbacteria bacterium CG_4_8_14_3_um_filter_50_23]PJA94465.1 MAG: 30S ribosomal protein S10 [Candidatus Kaiserbacteria bacterium CG_4_9_14_3_um_filter_50_16]
MPATATKPKKATKRAVKKTVAPVVKKTAPKKKVTPAAPITEHKLRIRVRAYEHKILDLSVKQIMDTAARFDAIIVGPVPLPTEIKRWTVNRSTFVHKDAREQFEMRIHKRLIDIMNPSPKVIEALTNLNLPSGVTIDVKMV